MKTVFARALVACAMALVASGPAAAAELGDGFAIGDAAGAAFPGAKAYWAGTCDLSNPATGNGGVGSPPAGPDHCIDHGRTNGANLGVDPFNGSLWLAGSEPAWRLDPVTTAGGRSDGSVALALKRTTEYRSADLFRALPDGNPRSITVSLPPGAIGNPQAVPQCPAVAAQVFPPECPPETQVGVAWLSLEQVYVNEGGFPVYNVEPRDGKTAELIIGSVGQAANPVIEATPRTSGDFGVDATADWIPVAAPLYNQVVTIWAVPWAAEHDKWRPTVEFMGTTSLLNIPVGGVPVADREVYHPSWGPIRPFFTNPTECSPEAPVTRLSMDSWQNPGVLVSGESAAPPVTDCGAVPFAPDASFEPTSTVADSASGLRAEIEIPQNNDPPVSVARDPSASGAPAHWKSAAGRATAHLDKTVVTLPEGFSVNPSAATGLEGCSDDQIGITQLGSPPLFDDEDPFDDAGAECPDGSRIGTVEVTTPLLEKTVHGDVVLGMPKSTDPQSGEMFRMFLVLRDKKRDLLAKVYGSAVADPQTGQLTATFDKNPQLPFSDLELDIKGGDRGVIATPQRCGDAEWSAAFTPWSAAHNAGGVTVDDDGAMPVDANCGFGFAPGLRAGMTTRQAASSGALDFEFTRADGEQWFKGLTAKLPDGLLAKIKDVPLCPAAQAQAGACGEESRIGSVDASAGSGNPFVLERKGDVYLTQGYKGGAYGLMVRVPVEAGPFRGEHALTPIVVRQAIHVDRTTAQVTVVSDPFPEIWHGIPLRVRRVAVKVDRSGFMLNPTDCSRKQIVADIASANGASSSPATPFQVGACGSLPFQPSLSLALTGKRQVKTGKHPGVKALVKQTGIGEAGIEKAVVRLPKSLALDPNNAQALCEYADGTKPDLENHCPKGSIVGRARAKTPLLHHDLAGDVYFVKNVRRDPRTGNLLRTLPMLVVALRGEIAVNLKGESSTTKGGKLVNTFAAVPDAPITQFNLNVKGGEQGILAVTRTRSALINLCAAPRSHVAEADLDGQNGKRRDMDVRMKTPCAAKGSKKSRKAVSRNKRSPA